jgi:hypothetical protein
MTGSSSGFLPPPTDSGDPEGLRRAILEGLGAVVPQVAGLDGLASYEVKRGVIFAWGDTDIDDPASGLHDSHAIGPRTHGRYHTVDTGKLTMAPLFGKAVADRILAMG